MPVKIDLGGPVSDNEICAIETAGKRQRDVIEFASKLDRQLILGRSDVQLFILDDDSMYIL